MTSPRIRIGNQTAFSASSPFEPFDYAVANGFDAFEWFPDKKESGAGWRVDDVSGETRAYIRSTAEGHDITLAVHASLHPGQGNGDTLLKEILFARDIGAALVNVHFHAPAGAAAFADALKSVIRQLPEGMRLSIENTVETGPDDFNTLFDLLAARLPDMSPLGMCLDMGHANLCSATRNNYLAFVDLLDPAIPVIHLHMHENFGDSDSHLPVFTGPSAMDPSGISGLIKRLRRRHFAGCMILEQWPRPAGLLNQARERLLDIIGVAPGPPPVYPDDFAGRIAEADGRCGSWRNKLGWVHDLLIDESSALGMTELAYLAVYLHFIGTGELPCSEDSGHYRPSYHAKIAQRIYKRLIRISTPENALIIRKILPWLPSFDEAFVRAEPLTRIRDIAHRNDIPQDLKREIKTTLQNKLHRSAGPEDLATSAAILAKITAPGAGYSPPFVESFIQFHRELEEFFNARSLDDQLRRLAGSGSLDRSLVEAFIGRKAGTDVASGASALSLLIGIRMDIGNRPHGRTDAEGQRFLAADIGLEGFSFSLLSRLNNIFASSEETIAWKTVLDCLRLSAADLRLSGIDQDECAAIESEITAWLADFDQDDRLRLLRLDATLERCRRMADAYCVRILDIFPEKAERLGRALGVPDHAIRVYAESEIRAHPVFQVSRLVDTVSRWIRRLALLPPWDVIVPGHASGRLVAAADMGSVQAGPDEAHVVFAERLTGEEDVPPWLAALITPQETPHLSHLAVRARQGNVVFLVCEDKDLCNTMRGLHGQVISLSADRESVGYAVEESVRPGAPGKMISLFSPSVAASRDAAPLPLGKVTIENSGQKAFSLKRLQELADRPGSGFRTPGAIVLPFGVMEKALLISGPSATRYRELLDDLDRSSPDLPEGTRQRLSRLLAGLEIPREVVSAASAALGRDPRLMVRSSACSEDREGSVEAGVYSTVANVSLSGITDAVRTVWSSLWSRNAALSRMRAGIPPSAACMSVIIQEMITPEYSFILHTRDPLGSGRDEVYAELAVGLGETLASGRTPGRPFRLSCAQSASKTRVISFASFSEAIWPGKASGQVKRRINYAEVGFTTDPASLLTTGQRLAAVGRLIEEAFSSPQDIEGILAGEDIYVVQSRQQAGLRDG